MRGPTVVLRRIRSTKRDHNHLIIQKDCLNIPLSWRTSYPEKGNLAVRHGMIDGSEPGRSATGVAANDNRPGAASAGPVRRRQVRTPSRRRCSAIRRAP